MVDTVQDNKTTTNVTLHIREKITCRHSLTEYQLLDEIRKGNLFGNVQYDIEVTENLRTNFATFLQNFKSTSVTVNDKGYIMEDYAKEQRLSQLLKIMISGFT